MNWCVQRNSWHTDPQVDRLQVAVGGIVVADQAQAVGANGDRGVLTDNAGDVQGGGVALVQVDVVAVRHLQVAVGGVVVADHAQAVGADRDRSVVADVPPCCPRWRWWRWSRSITAVRHLQVAVGAVVVADQPQARRHQS